VHKAGVDWRREADELQRELALPAIAGEWSLGLDPNGFTRSADRPPGHPLAGMDAFQEDVAYRAYGAAQLLAFERYLGWFFWSYRTETTPAWCFRECVERGWLPPRFQ
jgi:glucan 1,3-beta-glucosidase